MPLLKNFAPMRPPDRDLPPQIAGLLVFLLFGAHLFAGFSFIRSAAPTYDEPVHLASGYSYLRTGKYRLNILDHPPFAEMWAAAPLLISRPQLYLNHPDWISGRLYHYSDFFLYHNTVSPDVMIRSARIFAFLTWTSLLGLAVIGWSKRLAGASGMVGAAAAYAFCPALISNLSLVTTDGASAVLFFATFRLLSGQKPFSARRWMLAGLCAGLAYASKFNMVLLAPLAIGVLFAEHCIFGERVERAAPTGNMRSVPQERSYSLLAAPGGLAARTAIGAKNQQKGPGTSKRTTQSLPAGIFLLAAAGLIGLMAAYRFGQFPLYWKGLSATLSRLDEGRGAFFFGRRSATGFTFYFPVALFVKMPLPIWILAAVGLAAAGTSGFLRSNRAVLREAAWAVVPPVVYLAAAMTSKVQIGYRHVLPVVPFIILWTAWGTAWLWERRRSWGSIALSALSVWLMAGAARIFPHYLAYFNESVGGPAQGYRYLVDSNLDWGQDLRELSAVVKSLGDPPIYLSYFGTADPAAYGLRYAPVAFVSHVERQGNEADPSASGRVLFAISATNLQCAYFRDATLFDWVKSKTPLRVAGYSMFLYDLTGDGEACKNLAGLLSLSGRPGAAQALLLKLRREPMNKKTRE